MVCIHIELKNNMFALKLVFLGECKAFMTQYLECLKINSSTSSECRHLNKDYLNCRMQKCVALFTYRRMRPYSENSGLMEKDEWKNLGLANLKVDKSEMNKR